MQKNSLSNIHSFCPYELATGTNPKLPSTIGTHCKPSSKVISNNLKAMHKAREVSTASENSEKIKRARAHNIRTSGDIRYITGELNILQGTMFTSNVQTAENSMAQRQYVANGCSKLAKVLSFCLKTSSINVFVLL